METLTLSTPSGAKPLRISVSQIKLFERCARAYWYEYGEPKRKSPSTKAAAFGTEVHNVLEGYLKGEEIPETRAGRVASAGLKHLRPADELEIEANILIPVGDTGARILCRVDMLGTGDPYIGDHKTTSDFRWCRSVHEIGNDLQLLTYAYAAFHESEPEEVAVELVYYRTKGLPVSMAVSASVPWERIADNWREVVEVVPKLQAIRANKTGEGIEGNSGACGDYNGCFHCEICPFSPEGLARSVNRDNIGSGATHKQQTATTKEEKMTTQKAKNLQSALGLSRILPSQAPPQVEQTPELIAHTGQLVADILKTSEDAGSDFALTVDAAFKILDRQGVEHANFSQVLDAAGAGINLANQTVHLHTVRPETNQRACEAIEKGAERFEPEVFETVNRVTLANLAGELIERHPDGVIGEDGRAYCESRIAPNRKISDKRWATIVELSGLLTEEDPGYTAHPQAHDGEADPAPADLGPAPQAPRARTRRQIAAVATEPTPAECESCQDWISDLSKANEEIKSLELQVKAEQLIQERLCESEPAQPCPECDATEAAPGCYFCGPRALPGGLVVLVDCLFEQSPEARTLADYLAPHQEAVEAQNGVDYFEEIGFGKGPKMIMAKVLAEVMSQPPAGVFIVSSREPMAEAVIAIFRRVPGVVIIRGLK